MIEGPTTFGEVLRDIQRQIDNLKGAILAALGDHVLALALWIYHRAGRSLLAMEIAKVIQESAADELAAIRGEPMARDTLESLEDRCGAAPGTDTHQLGDLPRDCQKCHDATLGPVREFVKRNR